jgi:hypothetical protein
MVRCMALIACCYGGSRKDGVPAVSCSTMHPGNPTQNDTAYSMRFRRKEGGIAYIGDASRRTLTSDALVDFKVVVDDEA